MGFRMNITPKFGGAVPTTNEGILDLLKGSKFIEDAAAEKAKHVLAFRTTAAGKLAKIEAVAEVSFPKLRAARDRANAAALAAEIEWRKACDVAQQAQRDLGSASHTHSTEQLKLEGQLIETAAPEIAMFLVDMRDQWEACLKKFSFHNHTDTENFITGRKITVNSNNKASVMARQAAIRDAQAEAEAMRFEPDQSTISARLQALRNNLPAISSL
jgi:hypothetical protein